MENIDNQNIETEAVIPEDPVKIVESDNVADNESHEADNAATDWHDKYVRLSAEFDNYRKRTLREKTDLIQCGGIDIIKSILGTNDDFERALASISNSTDREGVTLISVNFNEALKAKGVTEMVALGEPFDVDFHEAIAKVPATDENPEGIIVEVVQKGYMLRDKVLRFAKVVVAE